MVKSITNFLNIIFFIFQQIDQNGYNPFCDETLHIIVNLSILKDFKIIVLSKHETGNVKANSDHGGCTLCGYRANPL